MAVADIEETRTRLQEGPTTLTGAPSRDRASVPSEGQFGDEEYMAGTAPGFANLLEIGSTLIGSFEELHFLIDEVDIGYVWKKKGATRGGRPVVAELKKASGLIGYFTKLDFVVVIHAPNAWMLSNRQLEAAVYSSLLRLWWDDENETVRTRGPELEMFRGEVERYGLWTPELISARKTFDQIRLPIQEPMPFRGLSDS
jgi:hypothetical protein